MRCSSVSDEAGRVRLDWAGGFVCVAVGIAAWDLGGALEHAAPNTPAKTRRATLVTSDTVRRSTIIRRLSVSDCLRFPAPPSEVAVGGPPPVNGQDLASDVRRRG